MVLFKFRTQFYSHHHIHLSVAMPLQVLVLHVDSLNYGKTILVLPTLLYGRLRVNKSV